MKLTPLSRWGKAYSPPASSRVDISVATKTPPLVQMEKMSGVDLLTRFTELTKKFRPHPNDYPILMRMRAIGLVPGKRWDSRKLDQSTIKAINGSTASPHVRRIEA